MFHLESFFFFFFYWFGNCVFFFLQACCDCGRHSGIDFCHVVTCKVYFGLMGEANLPAAFLQCCEGFLCLSVLQTQNFISEFSWSSSAWSPQFPFSASGTLKLEDLLFILAVLNQLASSLTPWFSRVSQQVLERFFSLSHLLIKVVSCNYWFFFSYL